MQQKLPVIFLITTVIIMGLLFITPMATLSDNNNLYGYYASKITLLGTDESMIANNWCSMGLAILIFGISIACLFVYQKKFLLLRLCIVNIILLLGFIIITVIQVGNYNTNLEINISWNTAASIPIIGIILEWMTTRYIFKWVVQEKMSKLKKAMK